MASRQNTASSISAKTSSTSRWKASCPRREPGRPPGEPCIMASDDDDPPAPYKVYEAHELNATHATAAEARGAHGRLESQAAGSEPKRTFIIRDNLERVVI